MKSLLILLIFLAVVASAFWAGWRWMRRAARLPARWQWRIAALLFLLVFLLVAQWTTGYTLALPMAAPLTTILGIAALLLGLFFIWHKNPAWAVIVAAVPLVILLRLGFRLGRGAVLLLFLLIATGGLVPFDWGWISPRLSYEVADYNGLIGRGTLRECRIYSHPKWFPLIQKRVRTELMPCSWARIERGPDDHTVQLVCDDGLGHPRTATVVVP